MALGAAAINRAGFIDVDTEGFGSLRLNDSCRPILRGESTLLLRQELPSAKQEKPAPVNPKAKKCPVIYYPFGTPCAPAANAWPTAQVCRLM